MDINKPKNNIYRHKKTGEFMGEMYADIHPDDVIKESLKKPYDSWSGIMFPKDERNAIEFMNWAGDVRCMMHIQDYATGWRWVRLPAELFVQSAIDFAARKGLVWTKDKK